MQGFYLPLNTGIGPRSAEANGGYDAFCNGLGFQVCSDSDRAYYATGSALSGAAIGSGQEVDTATNSNTAFMTGRHTDGSNFLAADGHVKWLTPQKVSGGSVNSQSTNNGCAYVGCGSASGASAMMTVPNGAGSTPIPVTLTFSPV